MSRRQWSGIETEHHVSLATLQGTVQLDLTERHEIELGYSIERRSGDHRTSYEHYYLSRDVAVTWTERTGSATAATYAAYVQDHVTLTDALQVRLGLRAELSGDYRSLQPRLAANYMITDDLALTAGAAVLRQYDHLLRDPDANLLSVYDIDIWLSAHEPGVPVGRATHLVGGLEATTSAYSVSVIGWQAALAWTRSGLEYAGRLDTGATDSDSHFVSGECPDPEQVECVEE